MTGEKKRDVVQGVVTVLFLALCLLHFFSQRPLWLDEDFVLRNMQELGFGQIFGPLRYAQGFPRVYLVIIKAVGRCFDYHVLSLRIFSLAVMALAYFVWKRIYQRVFEDGPDRTLAFLTIACSYYMSYYAAELKPYAMDVLTAGLFCLFFLEQQRWVKGRLTFGAHVLAAGMPLLLLFSYAGFFFVGIGIYNFLGAARRNARTWPAMALYTAVAVAVTALVYHFDLRHAAQEKALVGYWDSYFLCRQSLGCFMESFWEGIRRISAWYFGKGKLFLRWGSFAIPLFVYALVRHGFRRLGQCGEGVFRLEALGAVLMVELFLCGLLRVFPFTGDRITLFLAPFVFAFVIRGLADLRRFRYVHLVFKWNYLIFLLASAVNSFIIYLKMYG